MSSKINVLVPSEKREGIVEGQKALRVFLAPSGIDIAQPRRWPGRAAPRSGSVEQTEANSISKLPAMTMARLWLYRQLYGGKSIGTCRAIAVVVWSTPPLQTVGGWSGFLLSLLIVRMDATPEQGCCVTRNPGSGRVT